MVKIFWFFSLLSLPIYSSPLLRGMQALEDNDPTKAEKEFGEFHRRLRIIKDPNIKIDGHITLSWYQRQQGNFPKAMDHAYSAYLISSKINSSYGVMKSLSYLGWNYTALGLFDAGKSHLFEAIQLSSKGFVLEKKNKKNEIILEYKKQKSHTVSNPMIWGLASQELGHIYLMEGNPKKAKEIIRETYRYARENKILVGISESGNLLAKMELMEGNHTRALSLIKRALKAGKDCNCSPQNVAQSLVLLAEVIQKAPDLLKEKKTDPYSLIQDAKNYALDKGINFYYAHALLLEVREDKTMSFFEAEEKLNEAIRIFELAASPDQGLAFLQKATVKVDEQELKVAHDLFKKGIKLSGDQQVHLSKVNTEFITFLDRFNGNYKTATKDLWLAYKKAKKQKQTTVALATGKKLFKKFKEKGLNKGMIKILKDRVKFLSIQLKKEKDEDLKDQKKKLLISAKKELGIMLQNTTRLTSFTPNKK